MTEKESVFQQVLAIRATIREVRQAKADLVDEVVRLDAELSQLYNELEPLLAQMGTR